MLGRGEALTLQSVSPRPPMHQSQLQLELLKVFKHYWRVIAQSQLFNMVLEHAVIHQWLKAV